MKANLTPDEIINKIERIQAGDKNERENFIKDNLPLIAKMTSKITKQYIDINNSEEYSISLEAFNEAINRYDPKKSTHFYSFAYNVIRSRIVDFYRNKRKKVKTISISNFIDDSLIDFQDYQNKEKIYFQEETKKLVDLLGHFGFGLQDLLYSAPKHKDTRKNTLLIAKQIAEDPELFNEMIEKRSLPVKNILKKINTSKKILSRNRKYIIAVALILKSDLDSLKSYITGLLQEVK
ncbi:MAG: polymerase sigma factor [Thermosediminibacterales bacterium]|nr:polymerase sigma factor [Thermosediminibacterales bacterium]MDK2836737.1 polymerase sigma factor [Thermosediminibacterales bacterium]